MFVNIPTPHCTHHAHYLRGAISKHTNAPTTTTTTKKKRTKTKRWAPAIVAPSSRSSSRSSSPSRRLPPLRMLQLRVPDRPAPDDPRLHPRDHLRRLRHRRRPTDRPSATSRSRSPRVCPLRPSIPTASLLIR
uniref:Uncharacterized protein n=1 Tax=Ananas comosus var. bracteatus TaxID=296719 RepID=A0A6V7NX35_ANACO|nr:unnamed protein product [Ananas comosus var. bracteatus]